TAGAEPNRRAGTRDASRTDRTNRARTATDRAIRACLVRLKFWGQTPYLAVMRSDPEVFRRILSGARPPGSGLDRLLPEALDGIPLRLAVARRDVAAAGMAVRRRRPRA